MTDAARTERTERTEADNQLLEYPKEYKIKSRFPDKIICTKESPLASQNDSNMNFRPVYYERTTLLSDGCPVYKCPPQTQKRWFSKQIDTTPGKTMFRSHGIWIIKNDDEDNGAIKYGCAPQSDPFGFWTQGKYVAPYQEDC